MDVKIWHLSAFSASRMIESLTMLCHGMVTLLEDLGRCSFTLLEKGAVYRVSCSDCASVYFGEVLRNLTIHLEEHKYRTTSTSVVGSAIAEHTWMCDDAIEW